MSSLSTSRAHSSVTPSRIHSLLPAHQFRQGRNADTALFGSPGPFCIFAEPVRWRRVQTDIHKEYPFIISRVDMVEAAGIEPASEKANCLKPTCVADSVYSAAP